MMNHSAIEEVKVKIPILFMINL